MIMNIHSLKSSINSTLFGVHKLVMNSKPQQTNASWMFYSWIQIITHFHKLPNENDDQKEWFRNIVLLLLGWHLALLLKRISFKWIPKKVSKFKSPDLIWERLQFGRCQRSNHFLWNWFLVILSPICILFAAMFLSL